MLSVVCWLWRDPKYRWNDRFIYGPEHVNRLAAAVRMNLRLPHEVVCITDQPEGIDPDVRVVPIWSDLAEMGGCYRRLRIFDPMVARRVGERIVSVDLDSVIVGDLTPLFDRPEPFVAWRGAGKVAPYCGSLFMFDADAVPQVWSEFDPAISPAAAKRYVGTDQAWMGHILGPDMPTWGRRDGVLSFRRDFASGRMPGRAARTGKRTAPRGGDRIVFFHGPFDPSQPQLQAAHPWIKQYWS